MNINNNNYKVYLNIINHLGRIMNESNTCSAYVYFKNDKKMLKTFCRLNNHIIHIKINSEFINLYGYLKTDDVYNIKIFAPSLANCDFENKYDILKYVVEHIDFYNEGDKYEAANIYKNI